LKEVDLMGKSARLLGMEFGKTAREMNELLKEHGYLEGSPGAYGLTEKGKQFGEEEDHHRGVGGYAHYNRDWITTTWDEPVLDAIAKDIANQSTAHEQGAGSAGEDVPAEQDAGSTDEISSEEDFAAPIELVLESDNDDRDLDKIYAWVGAAVVAFAVGRTVAPYAKRWWDDTAAPRTKKVWRKITNSEPADAAGEGDNIQEEPAETR